LEITISSRHAELSGSLESAIRRKLTRLARFHGGLTRAEVHLSEERNPRIVDRDTCEVFLHGAGDHVHCKVSAPDGFAAIDKAVAKLEHQLAKRKARSGRRAYVKA
jgi:putative sigma-54 modulation protein